MTTPDPVPPARRPRVLRGLLVVAALAAALAAFWFLYHPLWHWWARSANQRESFEKLLAEQDPALLPILRDGMYDADRPDPVRAALATLLVRKNRLATVEEALLEPRLDVRIVALRALAAERHFRDQYAAQARWKVGETLSQWLVDPRNQGRDVAFNVLRLTFASRETTPPDVVKAVRGMVRPLPEGDPAPEVRAAAATQIQAWSDCESVPSLLALARTEEEPIPKMRAMQAVAYLYDSREQGCRDRIPESDVRALVDRALEQQGDDNAQRAVRMAAMAICVRHPAWGKPHADRFRATLDGPVHDVERRTALEAAIAVEEPRTLADFPRWFHDRAPGIRSQSVTIARAGPPGIEPRAHLSCLVGIVRDEGDKWGKEAFRGALLELVQRSRRWAGLPEAESRAGRSEDALARADELWKTGSLSGVPRAAIAAAYFRWLCEQEGLKGDAIEAAERARDDFWAKARAGDVSGAKSVLGAHAGSPPNLWSYERGWLWSKGG